jgi:hypothetical protein
LAGRIENAAHANAVAKASAAVLYENEIKLHLTEILTSKTFRGSRRCQEFLSYVVKHSLSGEFDEIKERILGISIFDRDANYDTSSDSIVRVTATDVRKRLLRYYEEAPASALRIELRPGSYIPEFHHAAADSKASPLLVVEAGPQRDLDGVFGDPSLAPTLEIVSIETDLDPHHQTVAKWRRFHKFPVRLRSALLAGPVCLSFLAMGWAIGALRARDASQSPTDSQYSFYKELLGPIATDPQQATTIVLSNPPLFVSHERDSPATADQEQGEKEILLPPHLARKLVSGSNDTQTAFPYYYLASDTTDYTGVGEAQTAFELRKLFDILNRPTRLTEARFLNWEEARNQHLISLGASTQTSGMAADFEIGSGLIHNTHPQPGEPSLYQPRSDGNAAEDYGLIWMSQSASGSRMLVLAGLTSTGTAGVGNFFCDPNQMKPIFQKLKRSSPDGSIPANWQVLLRITARDGVALKVSMVALRRTVAENYRIPSVRSVLEYGPVRPGEESRRK